MPANGFYIRHAKNVELRDVEIKALAADARPTFGLVSVDGAEFFNVRGPGNVPTFSLEDVRDFRVFQSKRVPDTELDQVKEKTLFPEDGVLGDTDREGTVKFQEDRDDRR